jgi:hypothetical protein
MHDLLPGVSAQHTEPVVVTQSQRVIRSARRRAALRDVLDLLLLATVDLFVLRWPRAHVPFLDRHESLLLLAAANAMLIAYVWLARRVPRWNARRIAGTWCLTEKARFSASAPSRARVRRDTKAT